MWQDPTDVTRRKPRRLRGTPAYRFATLVTLGVISTFSSLLLWYTHSEAAWVQRAKARVLARIKPEPEESIRREMYTDSAFASVISTLNQREISRQLAEIDSGKK